MTEIEKKGIGKAKVGLIVCAVMVVILAISNVWFYLQIDNLQYQVDRLTYEKHNLQTSYDVLQTDYNELQADYNGLQADYNNYQQNHFYSNYEYETAKEESYLKGYNDAKFNFYYVKPKTQKYGVENLKTAVGQVSWTRSYQEGVFDCSEMSAYMEWFLENQGFHAFIVSGNSPFGSGYHAWVLAQTSEAGYMPVEATSPRVVLWDEGSFDNYFVYDHIFETVQEALSYSQTQFDWWTVYP